MRLKELYQTKIKEDLKKELKLSNDFLVPKLIKVVVNVGFGSRFKDKDFVENIQAKLATITGQKASLRPAKKSVSAFKIREGNIIGASVTLRSNRMYDFVEKLVNITFPRVRDFRGLDLKNIDRTANLTIGVKEHVSFPEIGPEDLDKIFGLEISFHTNVSNREQGIALFKALGFPFKKQN